MCIVQDITQYIEIKWGANTVDGEYGSALYTENANVEDLRMVKAQMGDILQY